MKGMNIMEDVKIINETEAEQSSGGAGEQVWGYVCRVCGDVLVHYRGETHPDYGDWQRCPDCDAVTHHYWKIISI